MTPPSLQQIIDDLRSFDASGTKYMGKLNELTDAIRDAGDPPEVAAALFEILEKYPDVDFGVPGPIVNTLERMDVSDELKLSVARQPAFLNVLMVNRELNALERKDRRRKTWLQLLDAVLVHPKASADVKEDARSFLQFQS